VSFLKIADLWTDYELIDASRGRRLERWGEVVLIRPDPLILWDSGEQNPLWTKPHAVYHRSKSGGGRWEQKIGTPEAWPVKYENLTFRVKPMGFKHTGLFPEQAVNWDFAQKKITACQTPPKILNLFAYTGGATLACLQAGAEVTHVDASKGMVTWAKENAKLSGLSDRPVRWLVDDCIKFIEREIRRGSRYDAIIMDPPSYGRGPGGEVWKLEDQLFDLVALCAKCLTEKPLFFVLNSYTAGLSPAVMQYLLSTALTGSFGGQVSADEIGLPVTESRLVLPCGSTAIWES